jgi:hypothetical protein
VVDGREATRHHERKGMPGFFNPPPSLSLFLKWYLMFPSPVDRHPALLHLLPLPPKWCCILPALLELSNAPQNEMVSLFLALLKLSTLPPPPYHLGVWHPNPAVAANTVENLHIKQVKVMRMKKK